ncbi:diguanylate cyclase [bacterium]|nr:diguanylate cyclase [bacterium]
MINQLIPSRAYRKKIILLSLFAFLIVLSVLSYFFYKTLLIVALPAVIGCLIYFMLDYWQGFNKNTISDTLFSRRTSVASGDGNPLVNYFSKARVDAADKGESSMDMLDDTQASIFFNQTSDAIIQLIHQTFAANSTFLYLYIEEENELVLQSFRTESSCYFASSRNSLANSGTSLFNKVITSRQNGLFISLSPDEKNLFYYSQPEDIHTLLIVPLLRRGTLLGVVGVDHKKPERYSDHHATLLEQYGHLLIQTIQNIDGVYVKNKLRRMFQSLKEYNEIVKTEDSEEAIFRYLKEALIHNIKWDVSLIWMRAGSDDEWVVADAEGATHLTTGTTMSLDQRPEWVALSNQKRAYRPDAESDGLKKTMLSVPFVDHGHCFGVLHLESQQTDAWDMYEVQFIENLCHSVSLSLARAQLDKHLFSEMSHDPLTGLDNLQAFNRKVGAEINRAKRFGVTFSILIFYIDYVRNIYENFGVAAGDFVIEKIAEILKSSKRQIDSAARISNDQFGLIVLESKRDEARDCAHRILRNIEVSEIDFNGESIPLTAVIGIATFGVDGEDQMQLMQSAEKAVQTARKMKEIRIGFVS